MGYRILVTWKGETGYLHSTTTLDLRTRYGLTMDERDTATFADRARAERLAAKIAKQFERVEVVADDTRSPSN